MKHHFPHLNIVETRQLLKWLSDIKSQKCGCDYHLGYPLHGSPAYMETPLPTYDQVRNDVHRKTPDVGQHDWCLNRHLCDLREGFGKKHLNLVIVFHEVFRKMCSMKYVPQNMFCEMCSMKCSMKCVL